MPLSGTFDTVPMPELLQWLHSTSKTGTLTISVELEDTYLVLEQGDVAAVGSDDPLRMDFGHMLLSLRRVSEEQLRQALKAAGSGLAVPAALVQSGVIDSQEMKKLQREHLFELVLDLFFQEQGSFHFSPKDSAQGLLVPADIPEDNFLDQPISTRSILMESMTRIDEWNRIRRVFPNRFVVVHAKAQPQDASPSNPIWEELQAIGQPISVGELCLRMGGNRYGVYNQLHKAYAGGLIGMDVMPSDHPGQSTLGPSRMLLDNARLLVEEKQFDVAREVLNTVASLDPDDPEVRDLIQQTRRAQLEQLYQLFPPHRIPELTRPRESLTETGLSDRELYLASRLNGRIDVATLVVVTPLGELETLRILRKLMHAGIARFTEV